MRPPCHCNILPTAPLCLSTERFFLETAHLHRFNTHCMWNLPALPWHTKRPASLSLARCSLLATGWCFVLIAPVLGRGGELVTLANVADPGPITADEPFADVFSPEKAARYLDIASLHWQKSRNCAACHVNMGYLYARPALRSVLADSGEVRALYEEYATKRWKERPPRDVQETVVVASGLVFNDLQTTGRLHPITRQTLQVMWDFQRDDGGWTWRNDGYPPTEYDEHYGVTLAALTTGIAPDCYAKTEEARRGLGKIRLFLENNPPLSLHHRGMIAWVSCYIGGIMDDRGREKTLGELMALQRPDGGWSTPGLLADWEGLKRKDGKPHDPNTSDAYGTGFTIIVARELGMSSSDPRLQHGVDWLLRNQRVSGKWFSRSPATDSRHYFSNFGSAFAILALQSCNKLPGWPLSKRSGHLSFP